jgi:hypothetical protein
VYWNVQCGIVRALARNCGATLPAVVKRAETSGFAAFEAAVAEPASTVARIASSTPALSHFDLRLIMKPPLLFYLPLAEPSCLLSAR